LNSKKLFSQTECAKTYTEPGKNHVSPVPEITGTASASSVSTIPVLRRWRF